MSGGLDFSGIAADPKILSEGAWVNFAIQKGDGSEMRFALKLAYAGLANKALHRKLDDLKKPHQAAIAAGMFSDERAVEIAKQAYAEVIIKGLRAGDVDGEDQPYNPKIGMQILASDQVFGAIQKYSQDEAKYRLAVLEDTAKNSASASATS